MKFVYFTTNDLDKTVNNLQLTWNQSGALHSHFLLFDRIKEIILVLGIFSALIYRAYGSVDEVFFWPINFSINY